MLQDFSVPRLEILLGPLLEPVLLEQPDEVREVLERIEPRLTTRPSS